MVTLCIEDYLIFYLHQHRGGGEYLTDSLTHYHHIPTHMFGLVEAVFGRRN
jgi:hypothetical protein